MNGARSTDEARRSNGSSAEACGPPSTWGPWDRAPSRSIATCLEADGGTRTASVTGGYLALVDAVDSIRERLPADRPVIIKSVAAISVGIIDGSVLVDLDYAEDVRADVDFNVVMTGDDEFIEVQGTAEGRTFGPALLERQLQAARRAIARLTAVQRDALAEKWPLDSFRTTC